MIEFIEYDDIESRYYDNLGNCYNTLQDIPQNLLHLVKPVKPIKKTKTIVKQIRNNTFKSNNLC